jgi:glycosyltransferase involved in cell wall biosynthesis
MSPVISIITPTLNRHSLLKAQHAFVLAQSEQNFEWLILDDGAEPSAYFQGLTDPRIRYHHLPGAKMKVSAKRNWLCERATASVIAQFDDDDYYAPHYLAVMLNRLTETKADITKL